MSNRTFQGNYVTSGREIWQPTPEEIQEACETLLRAEPMNSEALQVVNRRHAEACRECAVGLLRTAREWKAMNRPDEVKRLVENARWYWRRYVERTAS